MSQAQPFPGCWGQPRLLQCGLCTSLWGLLLGPAFILRPGPTLFPGPCNKLPAQARTLAPLQDPAPHHPCPLLMPIPLPESRLLLLKFPNPAAILPVCPPEFPNTAGCFSPQHSRALVPEPLVCQLHATATTSTQRPLSQVAPVTPSYPKQLMCFPLPPRPCLPGPVLSLGHARSFPTAVHTRRKGSCLNVPQDAGVRSGSILHPLDRVSPRLGAEGGISTLCTGNENHWGGQGKWPFSCQLCSGAL